MPAPRVVPPSSPEDTTRFLRPQDVAQPPFSRSVTVQTTGYFPKEFDCEAKENEEKENAESPLNLQNLCLCFWKILLHTLHESSI